MRRVLSVLLAMALLCALCACGGRTRTAPEPAPENQAADSAVPAAPAPEPEDPAPAPETPAEEPAKPAGDLKAATRGLVGRPVSEVYAAIGRQLPADCAPSCLIDGEQIYDGFAACTERGSDYEAVYAVM